MASGVPSGILYPGPSAPGKRFQAPSPDPYLPVSALDIMSDAVLALGEDQEITYCNSAAETLYNFARAEMIGARFSDIVECRATAASASSPLPLIHNAGLASGPAVHRVQSGKDIDVHVTLVECGPTAGPHSLIAIVHD